MELILASESPRRKELLEQVGLKFITMSCGGEAEVETKVESLNNEIQNMMHEIRENTIITNARQSIMYNNQEIEKKFGYYKA